MKDKTAEFHKRQLEGIDWQTAAIDLDLIDEEGEYTDVSAPSEDCPCDACRTTEWY